MRGHLLLVLLLLRAARGGRLQRPPVPRRSLLRGAAAGALSLAPLAAAAAPIRRFGAGRQSRNSVADEATKLVWTPKAEVGARVVDEGYSGYAYPQRFVTYLARFLLNYDEGSAEWWAAQGTALPIGVNRATLKELRTMQFGRFSESVKVGLRQFGQKKNDRGPRMLYSLLRARYGDSRQAKLQLAILFSLLPPPSQPSGLVRQALGEFDNTSITAMAVIRAGRNYTTPPRVVIAPPDAQAYGAPALARAHMQPTGSIAQLRLSGGGGGYAAPPTVSISPPAARGGRAARAEARVVNGSVIELRLTDRGAGYSATDAVVVSIDAPRDAAGGSAPRAAAAAARAVLEQEVASIEIVDGGYGYAVDQEIGVQIIPSDGRYANDLVVSDAKAVAELSPPPEESIFSFARSSLGDRLQGSSYSVSSELLALLPPNCRPRRMLEKKKGFYFKLLRPVPATGLTARSLASERAFGPLGKTPVQREREVRRRDYWAFALSGAACTATIRTALLPVETTKVLMQVDAEAFPALGPSLRKLWASGGAAALFAGAETSALYAFVLGGVGFGVNEFLRRYLSMLAGAAQPLYALQIQVGSGVGAVIASVFLVCPLEVLRIRIAQRVGESALAAPAADALGGGGGVAAGAYEGGVIGGLGALYAEGGVRLLYSALLPMLLREVPFTLAKFLVFDATTDLISSTLPALQEYGGASALLAGAIAGVVSGLLTTPADTLVTRLSNARARGEAAGLLETARSTLTNEPASLFSGLAPRCLLFGATIGGQYLLYDFWTRLFRVSPDDLNLVLDVFADRLSFPGT